MTDFDKHFDSLYGESLILSRGINNKDLNVLITKYGEQLTKELIKNDKDGDLFADTYLWLSYSPINLEEETFLNVFRDSFLKLKCRFKRYDNFKSIFYDYSEDNMVDYLNKEDEEYIDEDCYNTKTIETLKNLKTMLKKDRKKLLKTHVTAEVDQKLAELSVELGASKALILNAALYDFFLKIETQNKK